MRYSKAAELRLGRVWLELHTDCWYTSAWLPGSPPHLAAVPPRSMVTARGASGIGEGEITAVPLGAAGECSTLALGVLCPSARSFPQRQLPSLRPPTFHLA